MYPGHPSLSASPICGIHTPAGGRAQSLSDDPPAQVIARPGSSPGTASTVGISRIDGGYLCAKHTIETTITVDLRAEESTVNVDIG